MVSLVASVASVQEQLKPLDRIAIRESEDGAQFMVLIMEEATSDLEKIVKGEGMEHTSAIQAA